MRRSELKLAVDCLVGVSPLLLFFDTNNTVRKFDFEVASRDGDPPEEGLFVGCDLCKMGDVCLFSAWP